MFMLIEENLVRQNKAMLLLGVLLEEEFSRLTQSKPQAVSKIELSIQELMRQIAMERASLRRRVESMGEEFSRVRDLFPIMGEENRTKFKSLLKMLDDTEQKCAVQAAKNNEMAMALFDQSKRLLNFMHDQIKPKNTGAYGASGRYAKAASAARILTGRL